MRVHEGIVPDDLVRCFPGWEHDESGASLADYQINFVGLEQLLAAANRLWPTVIEDGNLVLIGGRYHPDYVQQMRTQFENDKTRIERWINARELIDLFMGDRFAGHPALQREDLLRAVGEVLTFFWSLRLKILFPNRTFVVEVSDTIEGASGLAITVYEVGRRTGGDN